MIFYWSILYKLLVKNTKMDGTKKQKVLTPGQAYVKITAFCAYQERSHREVVQKLYEYGLKKAEIDELLSRLITENFINEERFAKAYAGGKFRMKHWGRVKIKKGLELHGVSSYCIRKGLEEIEEALYEETLYTLLVKKACAYKDIGLVKKIKTINYFLGRGYERDVIQEAWDRAVKEKAVS